MARKPNSPSSVGLADTPQLVDLIAARASLGTVLSAISTLLVGRFVDSHALVFSHEPQTGRLISQSTARDSLIDGHISVGPAGGVIGRAASESKLVVGSASSLLQLPARIANSSWCAAVPVLAPDGRVLAVISLVGSGSTPSEQVLGVLEVTARLAAMAAIKEPVATTLGATLDELTGLLDEESFWNVTTEGITEANTFSTSISVLLVQVTTANINDSLISRAAVIIASSVRPADTVAYLGAGRFGIVAPNLRDTSEMSLVAEQVVTRIERSPLALEAYVGAAIAHQSPELGSLREQALGALELAESRKLQKLVIVEVGSGSPDKSNAMGLLQMLRSGEIVAHYQPQVDLASGAVIGAEALARHHGEQGSVPIPMLEHLDTSTITKDLTRHMLKTVCGDIALWDQNGQLSDQFKVSVNATGNELCDPVFFGTVTREIEAANINPSRLCIEITESEALSNQGSASGVLRRLRDYGVAVAVDDFGTGYSSLSYLSRLPVDLIKLDRSFVNDVPYNRASAAIVAAVVDLASSMEMLVLAEGIEDAEQAEKLQELGVKLGQGWLYSAALPQAELIEFLKQN